MQTRIAIIGAGISGLICARTLSSRGLDVTVFEKSRGVGGRMATRRTKDGLRFDHGAQYFTVRDERFDRWVQSWLEDGIVAPWEARICTLEDGRMESKQKTTPRFVGVPGMSAVCRALASELYIRFQTQIVPPKFKNGSWQLQDLQDNSLGEFEWLVVSAPAPQTANLLTAAPQLNRVAQAARMNGCWAVMLAFGTPLSLPFDGAFVDNSPLSWVARNSAKPGRADTETWLLHASPAWSDANLEADPEDALARLSEAFWSACGQAPRTPLHAQAHRWRYALPVEPLTDRCLFDAGQRVGACGDWCDGPRVEGAFLSGLAVAQRVLAELGLPDS